MNVMKVLFVHTVLYVRNVPSNLNGTNVELDSARFEDEGNPENADEYLIHKDHDVGCTC